MKGAYCRSRSLNDADQSGFGIFQRRWTGLNAPADPDDGRRWMRATEAPVRHSHKQKENHPSTDQPSGLFHQ